MITVYALKASDEPLQVRYVGQTRKALEVRLRGHWHDERRRVWRKDHRKSDWLAAVERRGAKVLIEPLSEHETWEEAASAELRWIVFWESFCELLNLDRIVRRSKPAR